MSDTVHPITAAQPTPRLRRGLRVLGALLITLSAITPASSVFIIAPGVMQQAGTGAIWSFLAAGVVGVFMAFVYAELASAFPLTGGEYAIVGRTLGRLPGFMIMGMILVTQVIIIAVIALGVGIYLSAVFPGLNGPVVAAVTVVLAAVLGVLDVRINAWVTGIFLAIEILALVIVSSLGLFHVERPLFAGPVAGSPPAAVTIGVIGAATAIAIFAYNGYGSAVVLGEETTDAPRKIARTILWALVITVLAELIPVVAVLLGAPSLDDLFKSENLMEYFITARGGSGLNTTISLAIALAIVNAVLAILLLTARLFFSTGRDGVWPRGANVPHPVDRHTGGRRAVRRGLLHRPEGVAGAHRQHPDRRVRRALPGRDHGAAQRFHRPCGVQDALVPAAADPRARGAGVRDHPDRQGSGDRPAEPVRHARGPGAGRSLLPVPPQRVGTSRACRRVRRGLSFLATARFRRR
jgi:amino acid transporter